MQSGLELANALNETRSLVGALLVSSGNAIDGIIDTAKNVITHRDEREIIEF